MRREVVGVVGVGELAEARPLRRERHHPQLGERGAAVLRVGDRLAGRLVPDEVEHPGHRPRGPGGLAEDRRRAIAGHDLVPQLADAVDRHGGDDAEILDARGRADPLPRPAV